MVLVTGASGFLGKHLLRRLSNDGVPVRALFLHTAPGPDMKSLPHVSWVQCDLLDIFAVAEAMEGVTEVYHCAGVVSFDRRDKNTVLHVNKAITEHLVNEALERGIRKFLFVSSVATLGRGKLRSELSEEDYWEESSANSNYARSKYLAEAEVWRAIAEGLPAVIVNPAIILGVGDWNTGSAALVRVADREFPFYTGGINGWVDVADVVSAMLMLMKADIDGERFILSGGNHSYRFILSEMAKHLGKKPPYIAAGKRLTSVLAILSTVYARLRGKRSVITSETGRTAQLQCHYNTEKLLRIFPEFKYTNIDITIAEMAKGFQSFSR